MRYRFLLLLAGAAAMCGCGDPAPRQAPGAASQTHQDFHDRIARRHKQEFRWHGRRPTTFRTWLSGPGQIVKMNVSEGQSVKKGTVIAEINPREYMLQMEADKATYLTAQSQLERNKRLIERQAISRQDYETAEAAYVRARTAYDNSKAF